MNDTTRILIVDDEPAFQRLCGKWLRELGHDVTSAGDAEEALGLLKGQSYDLVLLDLAMPPSMTPEEGLRLLPHCGSAPAIVMTGHGSRDIAMKAIDAGAWDFLTKPVDPDILKVVVSRALKKSRLERELKALRAQLSSDNLGIVGNSRPINELRDLVRRIAPSDINVLILGESGTGKELVARAIHRLSSRRSKPFVPIHCGAIPAELLESEMFGHLKGSFTGADRDRVGLIETARGGTLFLDEIGEMPPPMQVNLLRFLQEGTFMPVGGREQKTADVRIVTATHRNLEQMIKDGTFREDLYYRIKGIVIRTPSLKERIEDIPLLVSTLLPLFSKWKKKRVSNEVMSRLLEQQWPGNVRELENLLESAVVLSGDREEIGLGDLQTVVHGIKRTDEVSEGTTLDAQVDALEKRLIIATLEETGHNQTKTAERLGISRMGLNKKMRRFGLR